RRERVSVPTRRSSDLHNAIDMGQVLMAFLKGFNAAVNDDLQMRIGLLQAIDPVVLQRRNIPVFFRAEALQNGNAGMHNEGLAARSEEHTSELQSRDKL